MHPSWERYCKWLAEEYPAIAATKPQDELIYLAAPYSKVDDKELLMQQIMAFSGTYMLHCPGHHIVSPLFNHFSLDKVPGLGSDYAFWGAYSVNLLRRCDHLMVICLPGWQNSTGVEDEVRRATEAGIPIEYVSANLFQVMANLSIKN